MADAPDNVYDNEPAIADRYAFLRVSYSALPIRSIRLFLLKDPPELSELLARGELRRLLPVFTGATGSSGMTTKVDADF